MAVPEEQPDVECGVGKFYRALSWSTLSFFLTSLPFHVYAYPDCERSTVRLSALLLTADHTYLRPVWRFSFPLVLRLFPTQLVH
jgi:hypothetical protein